jgi:hypothetical protein
MIGAEFDVGAKRPIKNLESRMKKGRVSGPSKLQRSCDLFTSSWTPSSSHRPWLLSSPCESPLSGLDYASVTPQHRSALCRLARRPGCRRPRVVWLTPGEGEQRFSRQKNWGAPSEHPSSSFGRTYRFFAAFFFAPLAAFFAIVFSSGCCDSASNAHAGRHYGWAEPSTLIPDVDYG